jgi:hypothetical protein
MGEALSATIYALCEGDGSIRYIGRTLQPLGHRVWRHLRDARVGSPLPVHRWIAKRRREGLPVEPRVLEVVSHDGDWATLERHWILRSIQDGARLLNLTLGGEGLPGRRTTKTDRQLAGYARMQKRIPLTCEQCGVAFWRCPRRIAAGAAQFCSAACKADSQRVSVPLSPRFILAAEAARIRRATAPHCKQGHAFTDENTIRHKGVRRCRACHQARAREHYARSRLTSASAEQPGVDVRIEAYQPQGGEA